MKKLLRLTSIILIQAVLVTDIAWYAKDILSTQLYCQNDTLSPKLSIDTLQLQQVFTYYNDYLGKEVKGKTLKIEKNKIKPQSLPEGTKEYWRNLSGGFGGPRLKIYTSKAGVNRILNQEETLKTLSELGQSLYVAEIGAGWGDLNSKILSLPNIEKVYAIDINKDGLEYLKNAVKEHPKKGNLEIIEADIYNEAALKNVKDLDAIVCLETLWHLSDIDKAIEICAAKLKDGGLFITNFIPRKNACAIKIDNYGFLWGIFRFIRDGLFQFLHDNLRLEMLDQYIAKKGWLRTLYHTEEEMRRLLEPNFEILELREDIYYTVVAKKRPQVRNEPPVVPNDLPEVAVVGLGRWGGGALLNTLKEFPVVIHAVARSNYSEWQEKKNKGELPENILIHTSERYEEEILKNPDIKAIIISTQFSSHFTLAKQALLAGKDVFVEKPFTRTAEEAKELVEIAEKSGCIFAIGYEFRYQPQIRCLSQAINHGDLGKISEVEFNMLNPLEGRKLDMSSNVIEDLGSHMLSLLHEFFTEREITGLKAEMEPPFEKGCIAFKYCRGYGRDIKVVINIDRDYKGNEKNRTVIVKGSKLMVTLDYQNGRFEVRDIKGNIINESNSGFPERLLSKVNDRSPLELEFEDFLEAVKFRRSLINNPAYLFWISEVSDWIKELLAGQQDGKEDRELKYILKQRPNILLDVELKLLYKPWLSLPEIAQDLDISLASLEKIIEKFLNDPAWCKTGEEIVRSGKIPTVSYFNNTARFAPIEKIYKVIKGEEYGYPRKVEFHVGLGCPANCIFCYRNIHGQREIYEQETKKGIKKLTPEDYVKIVNELADNGTAQIYISGGLEPLTDFDSVSAIITTAASRGLAIFLYSNAISAAWDKAVPLMLKTNQVRVSLGAATSETYHQIYRVSDDIRESGRIFYKILGRLKDVVEEKKKLNSKTQIGVQILLTPANFRELIKLAELANSIGVDFLDIRSDYVDTVHFSYEERTELLKLLYRLKEKQERKEFGSFRITIPDNFKLKYTSEGSYFIEAPMYILPDEYYSKRGIYPFELTIDPFGIVFGTTTSANPGIRKNWGKKHILGKLQPQVTIREMLKAVDAREFNLTADTTNVFARQMLLELKRVEKNMASGIPLDLMRNPFSSESMCKKKNISTKDVIEVVEQAI